MDLSTVAVGAMMVRRLMLGGLGAIVVCCGAATPAWAQSGSGAQISVVTDQATPGSITATVFGHVSTNGVATLWKFVYGPTSTYGMNSKVGTIPAGQGRLLVAAQLRRLTPRTTYHYELVAVPKAVGWAGLTGVVFGSDQTFATRRGKLTLSARRLHVQNGVAVVPVRCQSNVECSGTLSVTHRRTLGKTTYSVLCGSWPVAVTAGSREQMRARLSRRCRRLLRASARHRLSAGAVATLTGDQGGFSEFVTLLG